MSRTAAAGKLIRKGEQKGQRVGGAVSDEMMHGVLDAQGVQLRGGGRDEAPQVYRPLQSVLDAHADSIEVVHVMHPLGVVMAGSDVYDPFKD
jgi:tRNA-splicing ligase RtcB